jgi:hypothetical protein
MRRPSTAAAATTTRASEAGRGDALTLHRSKKPPEGGFFVGVNGRSRRRPVAGSRAAGALHAVFGLHFQPVRPAIGSLHVLHLPGNDHVVCRAFHPLHAGVDRSHLQHLAHAGLVLGVHAGPHLAADQHAGHGATDGGQGAAIALADLVAQGASDDAAEHAADGRTVAAVGAHDRGRPVLRPVHVFALLLHHPRRVRVHGGLDRRHRRRHHDDALRRLALALFLVLAVLLPLAGHLAVAVPELLLVLAVAVPVAVVIVGTRERCREDGGQGGEEDGGASHAVGLSRVMTCQR